MCRIREVGVNNKHTYTINGVKCPANTPVIELSNHLSKPVSIFDKICKDVKKLNNELYKKE